MLQVDKMDLDGYWAGPMDLTIGLRRESKYTYLSENVRASPILGFPNISLVSVSGLKWAPCLARVRGNRDLRTWNPFRGRPVTSVLLFRAVPARDWA
ncbi:hypothetical protein Tco_0967675 [Tanacetum coccineum]